MAKGKFGDWLTEDGLLRIEGWALDGLTDEQIAAKIGISKVTFYDWEKRFPNFLNAIKKGKAPVDTQVEQALLKRALGYDWEEVTTEMYGDGKKHVRKVTRHVPPDTAAAFIWLKNRKPDYWRDKPQVSDKADSYEFDQLLKVINDEAN